jgi:hypothetical protein
MRLRMVGTGRAGKVYLIRQMCSCARVVVAHEGRSLARPRAELGELRLQKFS